MSEVIGACTQPPGLLSLQNSWVLTLRTQAEDKENKTALSDRHHLVLFRFSAEKGISYTKLYVRSKWIVLESSAHTRKTLGAAMWCYREETEHFIRYHITPLTMMKRRQRAKTDCLCLVWSPNEISVKHTQISTYSTHNLAWGIWWV